MSTSHTPDTRARHSFLAKGGLWVVAQFVVMAAWIVLTPVGHSRTPSLAFAAIAAILLVLGAFFGIAGVLALGKSRTAFPRPPDDTQLVSRGVYAIVRHPLYTSLILLSIAWAVYWQSPTGAVLAVMQALLLDAKARREERWLRERFAEYAEYATRVRRLMPFVY